MARLVVLLLSLSLTGCSLLPRVVHRTEIHNPFPQLSKVAVAPFFNLTNEPTVDGRRFALAYFNELQSVPGYEVVPVNVVEQTLRENNLRLNGPDDVRRLAQVLGVDAVAVGAVTDFTPYYPPRCTMQVEWYAANPGFHPIPPGYGLPWGTKDEKNIPPSVVFQAEMALAREQLKTQTPACDAATPQSGGKALPSLEQIPPGQPSTEQGVKQTAYQAPASAAAGDKAFPTSPATRAGGPNASTAPMGGTAAAFPPEWPDPRGFVPPPPSPRPPSCWPSSVPVMSHTRAFNGHDGDVTDALEEYYLLRDDARFGGWQSYLERSDDFVRFCCHMHIREMLSARGGAGKTRVVWRWSANR
ncbi:MAG: hypothetical protein ABFD16_10140 [Thermoguttaceae bacterium]|jgi:hypothetical protein